MFKLDQRQRHQIARIAYFNAFGRGIPWSVYDYGCTVDEVYANAGPREADIRYASERHLLDSDIGGRRGVPDHARYSPYGVHLRLAKEPTKTVRDKGMLDIKHSDIDAWLAKMRADLRAARKARGVDPDTGIRLSDRMQRTVGHLRRLIEHPNTGEPEREAARLALERILKKKNG